jgi:membrane fusion protein (multidrug efflux system)
MPAAQTAARRDAYRGVSHSSEDPVPPVAAAEAERSVPWPLIAALFVLATSGLVHHLYSRRFEETDDAQIDGDISNISPRVGGTIKTVNVVENQAVQAGDLLAEIDPADYQVAVDQAQAAVAQAEALLSAEDPSIPMAQSENTANVKRSSADLTSAQAALSAARKEHRQIQAQLAQAEARDRNAQLELHRGAALVKNHAVSQSDFDSRDNAAAATAAGVAALQESLAAAADRILQHQARVYSARSLLTEVRDNAPRTLASRKALVLARQAGLALARAQLAQAQLNLHYTRIIAPAAGILSKKAVSVGDRVTPGQPLMALSLIGDLWVTADFRETQLARIRPGQSAEIHGDAIGADLYGTVESIGGATDSRFSILPPENAAGNYVKVVQRLPVRIRLLPGQAALSRLRPGMSVEPRVRVQ